MKKGLSPPKSRQRQSVHDSRIDSKIDSKSRSTTGGFDTTILQDDGFDKTQWGLTKFRADVGGKDLGTERAEAPVVNDNAPLLGEGRQVTKVRGEHLLRRPTFPITFLCIEAVFSIASIGVWVTADNPDIPQMIAYVNLALILILAATTLIFEVFRVHVSTSKAPSETVAKTHYIAYNWRFIMLFAHLLRALLLAANMTIMALDHDFDTGSIIVLAIQPIHLIIVGIHIIIALLPKIKH